MDNRNFSAQTLLIALGCLVILFPSLCRSQWLPSTDWEQTFGGQKNDEAFSLEQTSDGGYIVAGFTGNIAETGLPDYHGGFEDAWVLKLDLFGNEVWEKCLGGSAQEEATSIVVTKDGGYCVAVRTESWDGDDTAMNGWHGYHGGGSDAWIVRLSADHQILWEHNIGGSNWDDPLKIIQTADGGFVFVGYTRSDDGDVYGHYGGDSIQNSDAWIVKLDDSGSIQWQKCLGGLGRDWATGVVQTPDGGYALCGLTDSWDGDVAGFHGGSMDAWVVRIDSVGKVQWQRCLGGDSTDWASSIALTSDSGFIIAGTTVSDNNGDVSGYHGDTDAWVVKLSGSGDLQWQKCLGGSARDLAWSVIQTTDGGYAVAGQSASNDGDALGNHGGKNGDAWLLKLSATGEVEWQKLFGGSNSDAGFSIIQTSDGNFLFCGMTMSSDGDIAHNAGNEDMLVAKLRQPSLPAVVNVSNAGGPLKLYPNPAKDNISITFDSISNNQFAQFDVLNMLGQSVLRTSLPFRRGGPAPSLDVRDLLTGIYVLKISAGSIFCAIPFEVVH